ncbi:MAG: hypothetical protein CL917_01220 [Deltaproteobacteria bacterium]|nr:hypothetical protein [Deltaproteobacteria bacterium]
MIHRINKDRPIMSDLLTDSNWALLYQKTLYDFDTRERMRESSSGAHIRVPLFHFIRTRHGNVWRFKAGLASSLCQDLARLAARELPLSGVVSVPTSQLERLDAMRRILVSEETECVVDGGPLYRFEPKTLDCAEDSLIVTSPLSLEFADAEKKEILRREFEVDLNKVDFKAPCFCFADQGKIVSICFGVRGSASSPEGSEARLQTLPGYRRTGLASACLIRWAKAVHSLGRVPFYSPDSQNRVARRLAESLGLALYGEQFKFWRRDL